MRWRASATPFALLAAASAIALWPALAQTGPQSILPPGFGEPEPAANSAAPKNETSPARAPTDLLPEISLNQSATPPAMGDVIGDVIGNLSDNAMVAEADPYDLPPQARRSLDDVGLATAEDGGFPIDGFGQQDGRFLTSLMRSIDAPIASRWASILLRRALVAQAAIPPGADGADWVAERAWLLIRMGEADNARALVARVDAINFTPKLYAVAMQAALATGDPAALCPIADEGAASSDEPAWPLAQAMCAALSGESGTASALVDRVRDRRAAGGIDVLLAEKVIGSAANTRRAVTIQWDDVTQLTAWRYGMATATGATIPPRLFGTVGPQVQAWQARSPLLTLEARAPAAERAAALGVFSSSALVDFYGALWDATDTAERGGTVAETLRTAFGGADPSARLSAIKTLWSPDDKGDVYARSIMTARAAARLPADDKTVGEADRLVGSMLAAGLDMQAMRWAGKVAANGLGWGYLAVGAPRPLPNTNAAAVRGFRSSAGGDDDLRAKFLLAGLAGLNRITPDDASRLAQEMGVPLGRESSWTRALDQAVTRGERSTVAVIVAAGMQTRDWKYVPPEHLFHIVSALRRAGMEPMARMIAAEALART